MKAVQSHKHLGPSRWGAILVLVTAVLILIFAFTAFTIDTGYMTLVKAELQNAADASALAAARELNEGQVAVENAAIAVAGSNRAAGAPVAMTQSDVEMGLYNVLTGAFTPGAGNANAVRVTARVKDEPFFFAPVINHQNFDMSAKAISMLNPRDIVFVVDLSGSMNDDTEPCWATEAITDEFTPQGHPNVANDLMQQVYTDFGYGTYPGTSEYIFKPLGVVEDDVAYAEATKDNGPLSLASIDAKYRINVADDEATRR